MKEKLRSVIRQYIEKKDISGASVLIYKDGKEYVRVDEGLADVKAARPYAPDTIIRLFSMTKPITSVATMILIERGILDRLDPVSDYIPSFASQRYYGKDGTKHPVTHAVTVGNLLDMTAGLSYPNDNTPAGVDAGLVFNEIESRFDTDAEMTTYEVAQALGKCTLAFDPGTDYLYSTCADVLGAVIEKASGMRLSEFMAEEIFNPLGMNDTAFFVPAEKQDRLARSYVPAKHLSKPSSNEVPHTDDELPEYLGNNLGIRHRMSSAPAFESGGAVLASTLNDYMRFAQMLLNGGTAPDGTQILSPATVEYMTGHRLSADIQKSFTADFDLKGFSYGNLLRIGVDEGLCDTLMSPGEYGWDGWLGPYFANLPVKNASILIAMQRTESGTYDLTRRIRNIILAEL